MGERPEDLAPLRATQHDDLVPDRPIPQERRGRSPPPPLRFNLVLRSSLTSVGYTWPDNHLRGSVKQRRLPLATGAIFAAGAAFASPSNEIGFNPVAAGHYCEDLAESYQVHGEDRGTYLSRCIAEYREAPPGDEGSGISPQAASY